METTLYNLKGKEAKKINLSPDVFGLPWNSDLVHQVVYAIKANLRNNVAHTKTRGEVRGGGKKPWQQKGTGRARHGSSRSPIWVGGGITHGPRNDKIYSQKINKKMRAKALFTVLSRKYKDGEIVFTENLNILEPKTKTAIDFLSSVSSVSGFENIISKKNNSAVIVISENSDALKKSFRNINNLVIEEVRNLNPLTLVQYKHIVFVDAENNLAKLSERKASVSRKINKVSKTKKKENLIEDTKTEAKSKVVKKTKTVKKVSKKPIKKVTAKKEDKIKK